MDGPLVLDADLRQRPRLLPPCRSRGTEAVPSARSLPAKVRDMSLRPSPRLNSNVSLPPLPFKKSGRRGPSRLLSPPVIAHRGRFVFVLCCRAGEFGRSARINDSIWLRSLADRRVAMSLPSLVLDDRIAWAVDEVDSFALAPDHEVGTPALPSMMFPAVVAYDGLSVPLPAPLTVVPVESSDSMLPRSCNRSAWTMVLPSLGVLDDGIAQHWSRNNFVALAPDIKSDPARRR